jgi:hypothetical protein
VHKDLRRAAQAGGREVLRVEVIAPTPLLAGGLSNFPAIVTFLSDKTLSREHRHRSAARGHSRVRRAPAAEPIALATNDIEQRGGMAEALVAQYSSTPDASPQR